MPRATGRTAVAGVPTVVASGAAGGAVVTGRRDLGAWRALALLTGATAACAVALALGALPSPSVPGAPPLGLGSRAGLQSHVTTRLPVGLAAVASASIGSTDHGFWPVRDGASLLTQGGGIHGTFTATGARLRVAQGTLGLSLAAIGYGQHVERIGALAPSPAASQVLYRHGPISEFYRNGPYGLEQGFTVARRPHAGTGALILTLTVAGSLHPQQVGSQILFRTHAGATALRYGQLSAQDATGRQLHAAMLLRNGSLQLQIDDSHARYPLRIDPFIQQGPTLSGTGVSGAREFAARVALSANGNTALMGGWTDNGGVGAAWVFTRSGTTWTQQGEKLVGAGESGEASFGASVALSSNGNTALIGGSSAWVFTRSGSTWSQETQLAESGGVEQTGFGNSVALSSEGNTALIGGWQDDYGAGAAWVFTRSGSTWSQQGGKLTGTSEGGAGEFGESVALSADGNTALIGEPRVNGGWGYGAAWVFTRSGATWAQQAKLIPTAEIGEGSAFGWSVALSSDGNTALIGGPFDNGRDGAAWVFTRSGFTWTQQDSKLTGAGGGETGSRAFFGDSVALSSSGDTALIGGPGNDGGVGAAWVFRWYDPGCTDSWTNTAGGDWFNGGNWSTGAPPGPEEAACITAPGTYTVTMDQTITTGTVNVRSLTIGEAKGEHTLVLAGTCTENAVLATTQGISIRARGVIVMTNGDECPSNVTLAGPVEDAGKLYVEDPHGGTRTIEGDLANENFLSLGAGVALQVTGSYEQTSSGWLNTYVTGASDYGSMTVAEEATLAGTLHIHQTPSFKASPGQTFAILSSPLLTGTFATEAHDQINYTGVYYQPTYTTTALELTATQAGLRLSPKSGPPGSTVTVGGSGYLPGDTLTITFTDHEGLKTTFPSATAHHGGGFSTEITIPALAAAGTGTITITSTQTGIHINHKYTVT